MIKPAHSRAARGLLDWSPAELGARCNLSESTVRDFEKARRMPSAANLAALQNALESAGVIFLIGENEGPGVRLKKSHAGIDAQIADAKQRAEKPIPKGPTPASGMAKLRRGKAENDLRSLKEKKRLKKTESAGSIPAQDLNAGNDD